MKTIKTSVTILEDLHWRLKEEAARRRLSDREAWEQSVRLWLSADARLHALQEILNDPAHPMHATLDRIARTGTTHHEKATEEGVDDQRDAARERRRKTS